MESYECLCGKTFSTFRKLTGHQGSCNIYINNKIKNQQILQSTYTIECPACHRKFIDKNSLKAHLAHCKLYKKSSILNLRIIKRKWKQVFCKVF